MPTLINRIRNAFSLTGYDSVRETKKRRSPSSRTRHEDQVLKGVDRKKSASGLRELYRNFAIVAWAARKHLDYVSQFDFQMRSGDDTINAAVERLMSVWMRPANCDVTRRHPFPRMLRMFELRRVIDNDIAMLQLDSGHLQAIEGDLIETPANVKVDETWYNGVRVNGVGIPIEYGVRQRSIVNKKEVRRIRARNVLLHGFFDRFDQYRGVSPLNAAVNSFKDTYEGIDLALAKMKVEQLFALVFTRDSDGAIGDTEGDDESGYSVDFGRGPVKLELDPGDDAKFLKADNPGGNTREFIHAVIAIAIKALDLPFNFYDESHTNFFGSRAAWLLYDRSCKAKRDDVLELLRKITVWKLRQWIVAGLLELPAGLTIGQLDFEWVPRGMPWWDPAKEINGNVAAMKAGLDNPYRICKETGRGEFEENVDQIARAKAYAESKNVALEFVMQPVPMVESDP